jgi:hypothetical protein
MNGDIMEKYKPCLGPTLPKVKKEKLDLYPLLNPTLHHSTTPLLQSFFFHHSITPALFFPSLHHSSPCSFPIATDVPITNNLDSHPEIGYGHL